MRPTPRFRLHFAALVIIGLLVSAVSAENHAIIQMTCWGQHDTIYINQPTAFDIFIENDIAWAGIQLGWELSSTDGAIWSYTDVGGWGPDGLGSGLAAVTVVPGSRLDPIANVFDLTRLIINERDIDGALRDSIGIGGAAFSSPGILPGASQHMLSLHVTAPAPGEICIRGINFPNGNFFGFSTGSGQFFTLPDVGVYYCYPVVEMAVTQCGDVNRDNLVNLADPIYIMNYIFKGGPPPGPLASGDVDCSVTVNIGDVIYLIQYIFSGGDAPCAGCGESFECRGGVQPPLFGCLCFPRAGEPRPSN